VFDMLGPYGSCYPNACVVTHIEAPQCVVIHRDCAPKFTLTLTLGQAPMAFDNSTAMNAVKGMRFSWVQCFIDPAVAQALALIVESANEKNLDDLAHEQGLPG
jgi:hypothetical protein